MARRLIEEEGGGGQSVSPLLFADIAESRSRARRLLLGDEGERKHGRDEKFLLQRDLTVLARSWSIVVNFKIHRAFSSAFIFRFYRLAGEIIPHGSNDRI